MCLQKEDEAKGGMEGRALSEKVNLCDCGALEGHGWLSLAYCEKGFFALLSVLFSLQNVVFLFDPLLC